VKWEEKRSERVEREVVIAGAEQYEEEGREVREGTISESQRHDRRDASKLDRSKTDSPFPSTPSAPPSSPSNSPVSNTTSQPPFS